MDTFPFYDELKTGGRILFRNPVFRGKTKGANI
jgi:hypothetical protein